MTFSTHIELPMPELVERDSSGILYLTDDALFDACGVRIAFTGRHGGDSQPPFASLNVGTHVGDDAGRVEGNRKRVLAMLGADFDCQLISLNQVHGIDVLDITRGEAQDILRVRELAERGADGIAIGVPNVAAMLCFADCVPLILASPTGAFAVVHAGWRGVMGEIASKAIDALLELSPSTLPSDVNAYIGPHIRSECFEVSEDLAKGFGDKFGGDVVTDKRHVDLSAAIKGTLARRGVSHDRIADAEICTVCRVSDFFSYRAEGGTCGRHGAVAFRMMGSEESDDDIRAVR